MKRWGIALIVAVLSCLPVLFRHATSPTLLDDTDTKVLLHTIRERQAPFSWFTSDWPLENHFYRPVSTLSFELDNRLYGNDAAGYGWTNTLLCAACILLLAWFLREVTDSVALTAGATALFGLWHWNGTDWAISFVYYGTTAVALADLGYHAYVGLAKQSLLSLVKGIPKLLARGSKFRRWLFAFAAASFLCHELSGIVGLESRMIGWLPGRTASVMTVFCLIALAAYARYERVSAKRIEAKPTAMDEPATKSSVQTTASGGLTWLWAVLAVVAGALAFASYEQAVMLPTALFGVGVSLRLRGYRVRWGWQIAFWGLLVAYYLVRHAYVPSGVSSYQAQQFRHGPGVYMSLLDYLCPAFTTLLSLRESIEVGWMIFLTDRVYATIWYAYSNASALLAASRHWVLALTGFALSFFAYLPMAWLNPFDHYHYWPMAMRSLYVVLIAWGVWELILSALSPLARQAPARLVPAPGSLPRP